MILVQLLIICSYDIILRSMGFSYVYRIYQFHMSHFLHETLQSRLLWSCINSYQGTNPHALLWCSSAHLWTYQITMAWGEASVLLPTSNIVPMRIVSRELWRYFCWIYVTELFWFILQAFVLVLSSRHSFLYVRFWNCESVSQSC